jgi:hypothetical protein
MFLTLRASVWADTAAVTSHTDLSLDQAQTQQVSGPVIFSPISPLFAPLIGDPREPSIGMTPYLNEQGFELALGGSLDLLRWKSSADMEWGLGLSAGLWTLTQNPDLSSLLVDDWFTGIYIGERTGPFSFRFEVQDQKSNLGDALSNNEQPFYPYNPAHPDSSLYYFTRNNENLTVSLDALSWLRLYIGGGCPTFWEDFDPAESQVFLFTGLEAYTDYFSFLGSCRVYGTYHFKYQDQAGGTFDNAVQLGLQWKPDIKQRRSLRLALIYEEGHSEFGQFYEQLDQHWGISLFFDP